MLATGLVAYAMAPRVLPTTRVEADPTPTAAATATARPTAMLESDLPLVAPAPSPASAEPVSRPAEVIHHVVAQGDTLSGIADRYGVSPESIKWANDGVDNPDFLSLGQKLIVPPMSGILHTVLEGDTLLAVAELYQAKLDAIVAANAMQAPYMIAIGDMLIVPGGKPPQPQAPPAQVLAMAQPARAETSSRGARETAVPAPTPLPQTPRVAGLSEANAAFIAKLVGPAQQSMRETGVPASVTIAQAIWEADWGRSGLAIKANNYFGIKGRPNPGPAGVIWLDTWEHVNGRNVTVKEPFKVYNSMLESILDHGLFISRNSRYAEAMKYRDDPKTFIRLVHKAGYATDPAYTDKIVNLMERYNLYAYDDV